MILIILIILAWYFLWKKKYYIRIESVGDDTAVMEQVLKIELETTLRYAIKITQSTPYLVEAGNYFNTKSVVKEIQKHGGVARIKMSWLGSKLQEGPITA